MYDKEGKALCCYVVKPQLHLLNLTKIITDVLCIIRGSKVQMRILAYKTPMQEVLKRLHKHFKTG